MVVQVRSTTGDQRINDSTPDMDSPSSITAGDLLVIVWIIDVSGAQTITPPAGWTEQDTVSATSGDDGTRYIVWTKRATATDAANQGNADEYAFTGMNGTDDLLYSIFSLNDDAAGTVDYVASSLSGNAETGGGGDTDAPTQTITVDGSIALCFWSARDGTAQFPIDTSEAYAPTGGANPTFYHFTWDNSFAGVTWIAAEAEWDISDSPIGAQQLTHNSLASDVDTFSVSMVFEKLSPGGLPILRRRHE